MTLIYIVSITISIMISLWYFLKGFMMGLLDLLLVLPTNTVFGVSTMLEKGAGDVDNVRKLERCIQELDEKQRRTYQKDSGNATEEELKSKEKEKKGIIDLKNLKIVEMRGFEKHESYSRVEVLYESPCADYLPEKTKLGRIEIVMPPGCNSLKDAASAPAALFAAGTGEKVYKFRRVMHAIPLAQKGYLSVILMVPFYADRRPAHMDNELFETASEMSAGGWSSSCELAAIAHWLRSDPQIGHPHRHILFGGRSMGAIVASIASLLTQFHHSLVVVSPTLTPSYGLLHGLLTHFIPWNQLIQSQGKDFAHNFRDVILASDIYGNWNRRPDTVQRHVTCIIGKNDWILPYHLCRLYPAQMAAMGGSQTFLTPYFVDGGHVTLMLATNQYYVNLVADAFAAAAIHTNNNNNNLSSSTKTK